MAVEWIQVVDIRSNVTKAGRSYLRVETKEGTVYCFRDKLFDPIKRLARAGSIAVDIVPSDKPSWNGDPFRIITGIQE